jgi:hypothetical protein
MKRKLLVLSYLAAGAVALAAPTSRAAPTASAPHTDSGIAQAHAVRICDNHGDCWWSNHHRHRSDWDDDQDRGWRHGRRDYDDDHYGRAPHHGRDWKDRDDDRDRQGRDWDKDRDHGEWGRSPERERRGVDSDRGNDHRSGEQGMTERGEQGDKKK